MNIFQVAVLPLGAFWAIFNSLISAGKFINEMRETVITGIKENCTLTPEHRKAIFLDWRLSMIGVVTGNFTYSFITFWIAFHLKGQVDYVWFPIMIVGIITLFGAFLFIICGISDWNLIQKILR